MLELGQVWALSQLWYADRLDADFRGRTAEDAAKIFEALELTGDFWRQGKDNDYANQE